MAAVEQLLSMSIYIDENVNQDDQADWRKNSHTQVL